MSLQALNESMVAFRMNSTHGTVADVVQQFISYTITFEDELTRIAHHIDCHNNICVRKFPLVISLLLVIDARKRQLTKLVTKDYSSNFPPISTAEKMAPLTAASQINVIIDRINEAINLVRVCLDGMRAYNKDDKALIAKVAAIRKELISLNHV